MSALAEFLDSLFSDGEVVFAACPIAAPADRARAVEVLRRAYRAHSLELAGPPLPFQEETALASAELLRRACWLLVEHSAPADATEKALVLPAPRSPAEQWSADLVLRLLPVPLRRARALAADDPVAVQLTQVARHWPLSGVLTDVPDAPATPLNFGGHPGLLLLYAERLAENYKPAWVPDGPAYEYVELLFGEAGRPAPARPRGDAREPD